MTQHAKDRRLQPSSLSRTIGCPGWGNLCANIPEPPPNVYALTGVVAHCLGEKCLNTSGLTAEVFNGMIGWITWDDLGNEVCNIADIQPWDDSTLITPEPELNFGLKTFRIIINQDMIEAVQLYVDTVREAREKSILGQFYVEEQFNMDWIYKGMTGTGDHVIVEEFDWLHVHDYKNGRVFVDVGTNVGDNAQLTAYALGAVGPDNEYAVKNAHVTIVQPNAFQEGESLVRSISYPVSQLYEWKRDVLDRALETAFHLDAMLITGEWCNWCPANPQHCRNIQTDTFESAKVLFNDETLPAVNATPVEPKTLTGDELNRILELLPIFSKWSSNVQEEAFRRHQVGDAQKPDQFKLVAGRMSNRKWGKPDKETLGMLPSLDDLETKPKLKSPSQVEKVLKAAGYKKDGIAAQVDPLLEKRKRGKDVLVPVSDKRSALTQMFEDETRRTE